MIKHTALLLILVIAGIQSVRSQLSAEETHKIDSLFLPWNQPNHPGGAVGIMKEGKLVYAKAFGLASLEYLVPNTPDTRFNIASVSKQFTCMGIVLLDLWDSLSIDDDIRKHLPDLPDFGHKITIRHLMHHTSGLRSLHDLLGLAGWRRDDARTNQDLYRFMKNQTDLNFTPGDEYLYCNSGYMLMADIIEKITGESFPSWMKTRVFEPLGLLDTYVEDRYDRVVPVNASSYYGSDGNGFSRAIEYWGYVGSGNMHSTVKDLLAWMNNYDQPHPGWKKAFETMKTRGILNNGDTIPYAFGIVLDRYRNHPRLQHGGSIGGYRSFAQTFPEEELNIVILANFSSSDVWAKSSGIADLMMGLEPRSFGLIRDKDIESMGLPRQVMEEFCGHYWNSKDRVSRKIYLKEDTLMYFRSGNSEYKLLPLTENSFQMTDIRDTLVVTFQDLSDGRKEMSVRINTGYPILLQSYAPPAITTEFLESYTGRYYSPELDVHYTLYTKGDSVLMGNHVRHGDFRIDVIRENDLRAEFPAFGDIRIKRDKRRRIEGLYVSNGRVKNLWLRKL